MYTTLEFFAERPVSAEVAALAVVILTSDDAG